MNGELRGKLLLIVLIGIARNAGKTALALELTPTRKISVFEVINH